VETWTYQNINSVFHNPDTLELSHEEKMELAKKQKIIKHDNTRLTKLPWKTDKQVRPSCENYLAFWRLDYLELCFGSSKDFNTGSDPFFLSCCDFVPSKPK
jgi:hypothetical protein